MINHKKLFLIDSLGGGLSAFMLGLVLVAYNPIIGMPYPTLYLLSFIACLFCVYSFVCFKFTPKNWQLFMKIVAVCNLLYCCLTIGLTIHYYAALTALGVAYFVIEVIIIVIIAIIEIQTANKS